MQKEKQYTNWETIKHYCWDYSKWYKDNIPIYVEGAHNTIKFGSWAYNSTENLTTPAIIWGTNLAVQTAASTALGPVLGPLAVAAGHEVLSKGISYFYTPPKDPNQALTGTEKLCAQYLASKETSQATNAVFSLTGAMNYLTSPNLLTSVVNTALPTITSVAAGLATAGASYFTNQELNQKDGENKVRERISEGKSNTPLDNVRVIYDRGITKDKSKRKVRFWSSAFTLCKTALCVTLLHMSKILPDKVADKLENWIEDKYPGIDKYKNTTEELIPHENNVSNNDIFNVIDQLANSKDIKKTLSKLSSEIKESLNKIPDNQVDALDDELKKQLKEKLEKTSKEEGLTEFFSTLKNTFYDVEKCNDPSNTPKKKTDKGKGNNRAPVA